MNSTLLTKLYDQSPVFFQNIMVSAYGYYWKNRRYGGDFLKHVREFKDRETFTSKEWIQYQTVELRKLLIHAFSTVEFYQKKYSEAGFKISDFQNFQISDLKDLPFLEKDELRKYGKTKLLSNRREKGRFYSSSGSTGTPTQIYFSLKTHRKWFAAYERRVRNWAGVDYTTPRGMIGGRKIIPNSNKCKDFYRYNLAEKQTYFSAYHINKESIPNYLEGMKKHGIEYMVGYAMSNYFVADYICKLGLKAPKLKAVLTSSEKLTESMRETFKQAYQCKTFDSYSGMEACGLISENQFGEFLLSPDTGIIELLNMNGRRVAEGEEGEVICTGLINFDQPLIRYRIGDRAIQSDNTDLKSGLQMPRFKEILGRMEDVVSTRDGRKMVRFHSMFLDIKGLKLSQLIQNKPESFTINLVVDSSEYSKKSELEIQNRLKQQLGSRVLVEFQYLDSISNESNGKFKSVISKV